MGSCEYQSNNLMVSFATSFALQDYLVAEEGIQVAAKNNYQCWYIDGSLETDAVSKWNEERIGNVLRLIDFYKVKPIFHGNYKVPLASDIDELRHTAIQYTKKEIELASSLSAPLIIHGGVVVEPRLIVKVKKRALENYRESILVLMDYAAKLGVEIYLENLSNYKNYRPFHYIFTHEEEFEYILNNTNASLFLDVGHANVCEGNPVNIIEKYHARIAGMSFSNNDGVRDQHLALSKGTIDYREIIKTIVKYNWRGLVGFETRGRNPEDSINDLVSLYKEICAINNCFIGKVNEDVYSCHTY